MPKFNEGKEYGGIKTIKIFEFENTQITYIKKGHLPTKKTLLLTLQMSQSFNVRFQL